MISTSQFVFEHLLLTVHISRKINDKVLKMNRTSADFKIFTAQHQSKQIETRKSFLQCQGKTIYSSSHEFNKKQIAKQFQLCLVEF